MGKTNGEIIYDFKSLTDASSISDDTGWSDAFILSRLLQTRAFVIRQRLDRIGRLSRFLQMETPCLELIPAENCPCVLPSGCEPLVTKEIIPRGISGIISVTNPDNTVIYSQVEMNKLKYRLNSSYDFLNDRTVWFSNDFSGEGTKIYVVSKKPLRLIKANLIPENPMEIQRMIDCSGIIPNERVSNYDLEWKLDSDLTDMVLDITMRRLLPSKAQVSDIKNNNETDNVRNKQELIGTNS